MKRNAYAGNAGVSGAGLGGSVPTQIETINYLGTLSVLPSADFQAAVNEAIFNIKKIGAWSAALHLGVFCGANSADSLKSLHGANHASMVGVLTHTAYKGFTGFNATKGLVFGGVTAGAQGSSPLMVSAFKALGVGGAGANIFINNTAPSNVGHAAPGSLNIFPNGLYASGGSIPLPFQAGSLTPVIAGGKGLITVLPGTLLPNNGGSSLAVSDGLRTMRDAEISNAQLDLKAYWLFNDTVTTAQGAKLATVLANLMLALDAMA